MIGGSFIGSETAASLRSRGLAVTQVDIGPTGSCLNSGAADLSA